MGRTAFFIAEFSDLVHESPETFDFPLALHQVRDRIQRRLQKDLVHESPETLGFPLALHQVRDPIRHCLQKDLVHESPETLDFRWLCTKSETRFSATLQKPGAKPSEPASNVLP